MIDKYKLILDNDSDDSVIFSERKPYRKKIIFHIVNKRKGEPTKIDPSECEILEAMVIHDYREQGVPMDLKRSEELYKKIMKKK